MTDNALALIEPKNAAQYFTANGLDPVIEKIREQVAGIVPDISTEKGRKEIASLAYKVAKSKTAVDDMGKQLVSGMKEQVKAIDAERSRAWDAIEAIQREVRAPLTEWEDAEKERVAKHEADLGEIVAAGRFTTENWQTLPVETMTDRLKEIEALVTWTWQEFADRAKRSIDEAAAAIRSAIQRREAYDAEQAELARLRKEEAERKQREHEERIAAEAAANAKAEAEEKARKAAEAEAARVQAEKEKAEQERQRLLRQTEEAERDKAEAEARARKAEDDRIAAEAARRDADERAEREQKAAIEAAAQAERDRIADEQRKEAEAVAKREANKKHRAKVNNEALESLLVVLAGDNLLTAIAAARAVVEAVARGEIAHIKITY